MSAHIDRVMRGNDSNAPSREMIAQDFAEQGTRSRIECCGRFVEQP
jgi:hypothetical protein